MDIIRQLTNRLSFDKKGVEAETQAALEHNRSFNQSLIPDPEEDGVFIEPDTGSRFRISYNGGKKQMTRILTEKEIAEINNSWPKSGE